jgi:hypothetical protein
MDEDVEETGLAVSDLLRLDGGSSWLTILTAFVVRNSSQHIAFKIHDQQNYRNLSIQSLATV